MVNSNNNNSIYIHNHKRTCFTPNGSHMVTTATEVRQPFVPYYLRTDLPANRTSKKRVANQRRKRKVVEDLLNSCVSSSTSSSNPSLTSNPIFATQICASTCPSSESPINISHSTRMHPSNPMDNPFLSKSNMSNNNNNNNNNNDNVNNNGNVNNNAGVNAVDTSSASSNNNGNSRSGTPTVTTTPFDLSSSTRRQEQILNIIKKIQMQQQQQQQQQQQLYQQNIQQPLHNVSVSAIRNQLYQPIQGPHLSNHSPRYQLTPTVNQMIRQWERKIDEKRQEQLEQQFLRHYYRHTFGPKPYNRTYGHLPSLSISSSQHVSPRMEDGELSPTTSSASAESTSTLDDGSDLYQVNSTSSKSTSALPSIKSLKLPPLNLPKPGNNFFYPNSDEFRFSTPRGSLSARSSISETLSSPRILSHRIRNSPHHCPYPLPARSPRISPLHSPRSLTSGKSTPTSSSALALSGREDTMDVMEHSHQLHMPSSNNNTRAISTIGAHNHSNGTNQIHTSSPSKQETLVPQQEDLFQTVFRHTPIPMAIITIHGTFITVNNAFVQMLGYSSENDFKDKECSQFTLQLFGEKVFLQQLLYYVSKLSTSRKSPIASQNDTAVADESLFMQNFLHKNGKIVKTTNSVGILENVFGEEKLILHTVTKYYYL